jgi:serine/threonine-protein kinase RsbW
VQVVVRLSLPRDAATVSISRYVVRSALTALGVAAEVRHDIELAVTEACANVVRHAHHSDDYEINVSIQEDLCAIDVVDSGNGFDEAHLQAALPHPTEEEGRGLHIIRMLTENVQLAHHPKRGSVVHFEKQLVWDAGSLVRELA